MGVLLWIYKALLPIYGALLRIHKALSHIYGSLLSTYAGSVVDVWGFFCGFIGLFRAHTELFSGYMGTLLWRYGGTFADMEAILWIFRGCTRVRSSWVAVDVYFHK